MNVNPHQVTRDFEHALCDYTGAKYAVTVNSCTSALLLSLAYFINNYTFRDLYISIPKFTYVSVPQVIIHAGAIPKFINKAWIGAYQLEPLPIWDSARRFTSGMYMSGAMQCVSFHSSKILGLEQGGAILHDSDDADKWFRKARFDGRTEGIPAKDDCIDMLGYHCYMNPSTAAQGLLKLYSIPLHNKDLPNDDYPDLSKLKVFQ